MYYVNTIDVEKTMKFTMGMLAGLMLAMLAVRYVRCADFMLFKTCVLVW